MLSEGYVAAPRKIERTEIFKDNEKLGIYMKLLFLARFRETVIDGITVKENQILCTKAQLSKLFGVNERKVRTVLDGFVKMGGIKTENIKNRHTLITILPPFLYTLPQKTEKEIKASAETVNKTSFNSECLPETIKSCGTFRNVILSDEELKEFSALTSMYESYINSLSAYLVNYPQKKYKSHYALLISQYENDRITRLTEIKKEEKPKIEASYDILRAEERARTTVPKVKKREKRESVF
ncbi:MAG: hypothetical protein IKL10_09000 [Clostridia bacterium]|nr:hypothetical protein [Clostridia bacterium]